MLRIAEAAGSEAVAASLVSLLLSASKATAWTSWHLRPRRLREARAAGEARSAGETTKVSLLLRRRAKALPRKVRSRLLLHWRRNASEAVESAALLRLLGRREAAAERVTSGGLLRKAAVLVQSTQSTQSATRLWLLWQRRGPSKADA
jgi:hypothetical protein